VKFTLRSSFSGCTHTLDVPCTQEQLEMWRRGTHIQDAMPNIPAGLREFLMTGITPEEWEEMFGTHEKVEQ
jgi:hypothetical protein